MANEQNLIPFTSNQSREEAEKNGRKGGYKSGEVRRQRKAMKEQMEKLLSLPFNLKDKQGNEVKRMLAGLGLEEDEIDNQMAMMIALWRTAISGGKSQVAAVQEIRKITQDEKDIEESSSGSLADEIAKAYKCKEDN